MAGIPPADPNQYFTPTFSPDMPQETATHFRQLYLSASQHDQTLKILHTMITAPTTTTTIVTSTPTIGGVLPGNTPAITSEFITAYNSTNGAFSQAGVNFTDIVGVATTAQVPALSAITGNITASQGPTAAASGTVHLGPRTLGGTQGSLTLVNGIITAFVDPT